MAMKLRRNSDNPVVLDQVEAPLTGESDIADATVVVTLYQSDKTTAVTGATDVAAPWNATILGYVAVIADTVSLTLGAGWAKAVITRGGTDKRTKWVATNVVDE